MKLNLWYITQVLTVSMCTNFEQNRPTLISKPAPLSQAEALNFTPFVMTAHVDIQYRFMIYEIIVSRG